MKKLVQSVLVVAVMCATLSNSIAQGKFFTKTGTVSFDAEGSMKDVEEIKATTKTATCVIATTTGAMEWAILMKSFKFKSALMQEHFNENYVESSKFPKASFKGTIDDAAAVKWDKDGSYPVSVTGKMTCHGVTKDLKAKGTIVVKGGIVTVNCSFNLTLADYKITVPSVVGKKVADVVQIVVNTNLAPLKK
jgi:polyisoprenoid-binding protein YceI